MIPDMTIGQLYSEADSRWGEIWDENAARLRILLIYPRKERKMMELHGDMIEHGQPVVAVFHRPRAEADLLKEQGFDPRAASFQFVNIATADLGPWMQQLVNNEGWLRSSIALSSTPFSIGLPSQRAFEAVQTLCFRHPSLPALEQYFLPYPAESLPGKCFVSLPRRAAAEMARQQAEVLGVGPQLLLDAEQLVVLGDAVGAACRAGLDLTGVQGHSQIGNGGVLGFPTAVAHH